MNLISVSAYVLNLPERDIIWAKRNKEYRRIIYGRSKTIGFFQITGKVVVSTTTP